MQRSLIIFFLLPFYSLFAQTERQGSSCLVGHLKELKSISPNDIDFSDLEFLKEVLKGVEIVALGEATHGDGTTFEAKIRLVKFLHEELGFDVLAFESGFYDCYKTWQLIEQGRNADSIPAYGIFGVWSGSKQVQPLFSYIESEKHTEHPLILSGFDFQFSGSASEEFLIDDLKTFLDKLNINLAHMDGWNAFAKDIQGRADYSSENGQVAMDYLEKIGNELSKLEPTPEISFWLQWIKSTKALITDRKYRDKYMAENFIWLKENSYANKKIICWGASGHFLFNPSEFGVRHYEKYLPMGEYLKRQYGSKFYTIGFTPFEGERGWAWQEAMQIKPAKKRSLEYVINQHCGTEHCFIDFRAMDSNCSLKRKKIKARPFGWTKFLRMNISLLMDGLIFHEKMEKSVRKEN